MIRRNTPISLLTFAIAAAANNQALYSDAFIVENAFQPESNAMDFDLAMHTTQRDGIAKTATMVAP